MNDHIAEPFASILNSFAPKVEFAPLVATKESSTEVLNQVADYLCKTQAERDLIQGVYNLARSDGALQSTLDALATIKGGA